MYSVHVSSTNDRELPPPELGRGLTWDRLTEILLREVSAEAAGILAEPIQDAARGQTRWHITAQDNPKPIAALSDAERNKLLTRLNERRKEILRFAASVEAEGGDANLRLATALRSVLVVPDEKLHVWSADGKPVLTAWGRSVASRQASTARFIKRQSAPPVQSGLDAGAAIRGTSAILPSAKEAPSTTAEARQQPDDAPPPPITPPAAPSPADAAASPIIVAAPPPSRRWPAILLWALFAVLVAIGYYALLPACGLDLPVLGRLSDRCEFANSTDLDSARLHNFALRDAIKSAELKIAQNRAACLRPAQHSNIEDRRLDAQEAEERRVTARASHGKLDITLVWNGREDLDLHVFCPGGHISFNSRSSCGGRLEIDRNSNKAAAVENPLEHITWQEEPPAGDYRVDVILFDRFDLPARDIPFTVVVRDATSAREYAGTIQHIKESMTVATFHR
jgi:hypothetical protein